MKDVRNFRKREKAVIVYERIVLVQQVLCHLAGRVIAKRFTLKEIEKADVDGREGRRGSASLKLWNQSPKAFRRVNAMATLLITRLEVMWVRRRGLCTPQSQTSRAEQ